MHFSTRAAEALRVHSLVKYSAYQAGQLILFSGRVDIAITVYFDKRPYDSDNIASKPYIDGLKGFIIVDDTRKYVRRVSAQSEIDRLHPRVEIDITKVDE